MTSLICSAHVSTPQKSTDRDSKRWPSTGTNYWPSTAVNQLPSLPAISEFPEQRLLA